MKWSILQTTLTFLSLEVGKRHHHPNSGIAHDPWELASLLKNSQVDHTKHPITVSTSSSWDSLLTWAWSIATCVIRYHIPSPGAYLLLQNMQTTLACTRCSSPPPQCISSSGPRIQQGQSTLLIKKIVSLALGFLALSPKKLCRGKQLAGLSR